MPATDIYLLVLVAVVVILIAAIVVIASRGSRSAGTGRPLLVRVLAATLSLGIALLALELVFRFALVQSDSWAFTLSSKRWFALHWQLNDLGFRDSKHSLQSLTGRRSVVVVGDSFANGFGIVDPADRFGDRLGRKLGDDWVVINLARNGWHTSVELKAVKQLPLRPDVIILSYYLNDIMEVANALGKRDPSAGKLEQPPAVIRPLVDGSYLWNFAYWRLYRLRGTYMTHGLKNTMREMYDDPEVWQQHAAYLRAFAEHARNTGSQLVVVAFPHLRDIEGTLPITARVTRLFEGERVPVIDLGERLRGREPMSLVVNSMDAHPSVALHREIGDILYREVFEPRLKPGN